MIVLRWGVSFNVWFLYERLCDADTIAVIEAMGWRMKAKETDEETQIGVAIFQKPVSNEIYEIRTVAKPEICPEENNPDAAW